MQVKELDGRGRQLMIDGAADAMDMMDDEWAESGIVSDSSEGSDSNEDGGDAVGTGT